MKIDMDGRKQLAAKLQAARKDVMVRLRKARVECAEDLLTTSIPFTPMSADVGAGELRRSGYADHVSLPDTSIVGFSDPKAPIVHERLAREDGSPIQYTTPGTQAKFLETPFLANRRRYANYMIDQAKRGLNV